MSQIFHSYDGFSTVSAEVIVPHLFQILKDSNLVPGSVVDFGCGPGTFLNVFKKIGIKNVLGLDGPHVVNEAEKGRWELFIQKNEILSIDFEKEISSENSKIFSELGTFDLAVCLEVAEHLLPSSAEKLVQTITSTSKLILWSAAIPGQTGENHFNEQWPEYWQALFEKHGYVFLDPFRLKLWNDRRVEWWYRQNLFLVVHKSLVDVLNQKMYGGDDFITPELYQIYVSKLARSNGSHLKTNPLRKILGRLKRKVFL